MDQSARDATSTKQAGDEFPQNILIAEDEHLVAADLAESVRSLGIEVIGPVSDGDQAIELASATKPEMALIDIRMPALNGLDAAEKLFRQHDVPVIIVSAHADREYVNRGSRIGIFGYLVKPVTTDDLRVALAVAWARYRKDQELHGKVDELKTALENRKLIERAKGMLMDRLGLNEADAMRRLQKKARDTRRTMADLSRAIIESSELMDKE